MKIFDAHFHIIDYRYPVIGNNGYYPPEFTIEEYRKETSTFQVVGGAIVSSSFQGFDQSYLQDSLKRIGDKFYGVANIRLGTAEQELKQLHERKATGFGRVDFDPIEVMKKVHEINPAALLFGTDLPSTRAKTPFSVLDIQRIKGHFSGDDQERIFYQNAEKWYKR